MSDEDPVTSDPSTAGPKSPESHSPEHLRDRLRSVAARLRQAAGNLGGEVMIEIPSRLGDHEGLLIALANTGVARAADASGVTLSVDGRNEPAQFLYRKLGFEVFDRREVYLAIWR